MREGEEAGEAITRVRKADQSVARSFDQVGHLFAHSQYGDRSTDKQPTRSSQRDSETSSTLLRSTASPMPSCARRIMSCLIRHYESGCSFYNQSSRRVELMKRYQGGEMTEYTGARSLDALKTAASSLVTQYVGSFRLTGMRAFVIIIY